jgi:hypothetical protein
MRLLPTSHISPTEQQDFARWLITVGHGCNVDDDFADITLPPEITTTSVDHLINNIYTGISHLQRPSSNYFLNRCILSPRNLDVNEINNSVLDKMPGHIKTYISAESLINETDDDTKLPTLRTTFYVFYRFNK